MSDVEYDEPGSRTRQAWLRTALGVAALTLLIERGLVVRGMPLLLGLAAIAPVVLLAALAARRSSELRPHRSAGPSRVEVQLTALAVLGIAVAAAVAIAVP